ncbi:MAG: tRNA (guanine-N1)-methyltransferase, partial [Cyanobacteria bacterium J06632_3]
MSDSASQNRTVLPEGQLDRQQEDNQQGDWRQEGTARFSVGNAFFRASSQIGRDLAILAAAVYKQQNQRLRVLDAMTGCGVRPLRYALEAKADFVWANEGNWDLHNLLNANLSNSLSTSQYCITHKDANALFFERHQQKDFFDLIDIDSFGSPQPTLTSALWAIRLGGLIYLTSTDGRATSGHAPNKSLQTYGAYARAHPAIHEQGLRLLIGAAVQQAATRGLGAQPVFSWYHGDVNRVMMRITRQSAWNTENYGFLTYCHHCGQFQTLSWKKLGRSKACVCQSTELPVVSGPMWLGPLHHQGDLVQMEKIAIAKAQDPDTTHQWQRCRNIIEVMQAEALQPPYYYPLAEIGRRGKIDIPARAALIKTLMQHGFSATRTH